MQALVLDFDGVISDSVRESFAVALRAYLELRPDSPLHQRDGEELFGEFVDLMPLGNRAEDYGATLAALETGQPLPDQESYDAFRSSQDSSWLARYHRRFYDVRGVLSRENPEAWRAMMSPYRPLLDVLERRAGEVAYAIATSKDRSSVDALLATYGIAELFPSRLILDKEAGARKTAHLRRLHELLGADYPEMTFVDDKVNHLDSVATLGTRCALAAWGYNGRREHELARERGYLVCALEDAERLLFD